MIIHEITTLRKTLQNSPSIGFVPTMGYLHEGHLSLIKAARQNNQIVVVSIFVNPTQFAPDEDFESYPRDLQRDYTMAREAGADIIFAPSVDEMYVKGASTSVVVDGPLTQRLCGASRPTHFKGVTTVVNTLLNIVKPHRAYFGQKDAQQALIIKKMVRDLHMAIDIVVCPIVREPDGLAMSSRNTYLSFEERKQALVLSQSLKLAKKAFDGGIKDCNQLLSLTKKHIQTVPLANIDYIELLNTEDLSPHSTIENETLLAVAVRFGKTRLIDNCLLTPRG